MVLKASKETLGNTTILKSGKNGNPRLRILIATATLGIVRMEWAVSRYGQVIPCNWSAGHTCCGIGTIVPMHWLVADAQNLAVKETLERGYEWLLLWEDDVLAPLNLFVKLNHYMKKATIPIISGLYYLKTVITEPILYRGYGNGAFEDFKLGDKVWVDGVPTGCLLIHNSILRIMWNDSEVYPTLGGISTRKVFETPANYFKDPKSGRPVIQHGTSDLYWCNRVIKEDVLKRAGWPRIAKKKYPFLCDTNIFCKHIDLTTGQQYPAKTPK